MGTRNDQDLSRVNEVLDDLYADGADHPVARGRIVGELSQLGLQDDLMNYFAKLQPRDYTRDELASAIDGMIQNDGRELELGLIH